MFVSFVVATFNCVEFTSDFLRGIDELNFDDFEVLVSDGGSTDGTVEALTSSGKIKVIKSSSDKGIYDAWNYGLNCASGDFISFVGIDDRPAGEFLKLAKEYFNEGHSIPALIYGNAIIKRGRRQRLKAPPPKLKFVETDSLVFDFVHPGALNNRLLFKGNCFDPDFRLAGDIDFYLGVRAALRNMGVVKIDEIQVTVGANGLSNGPDAYSIYYDEFLSIESKRAVDFRSILPKYRLRSMLRYTPTFFSWARDLSWLLNSTSENR